MFGCIESLRATQLCILLSCVAACLVCVCVVVTSCVCELDFNEEMLIIISNGVSVEEVLSSAVENVF